LHATDVFRWEFRLMASAYPSRVIARFEQPKDYVFIDALPNYGKILN